MRPSTIVSLIENLPPESAYFRAIVPSAVWTPAEHLLALVADLLASANWQRGGGSGRRPEPLPRPGGSGGDLIEAQSFDSPEDFMAWRARQIDSEQPDDGGGEWPANSQSPTSTSSPPPDP